MFFIQMSWSCLSCYSSLSLGEPIDLPPTRQVPVTSCILPHPFPRATPQGQGNSSSIVLLTFPYVSEKSKPSINVHNCFIHIQKISFNLLYIIFQGICPKLEFVSVTNIKESLSPELDALEDALKDERVSCRLSWINWYI